MGEGVAFGLCTDRGGKINVAMYSSSQLACSLASYWENDKDDDAEAACTPSSYCENDEGLLPLALPLLSNVLSRSLASCGKNSDDNDDETGAGLTLSTR